MTTTTVDRRAACNTGLAKVAVQCSAEVNGNVGFRVGKLLYAQAWRSFLF